LVRGYSGLNEMERREIALFLGKRFNLRQPGCLEFAPSANGYIYGSSCKTRHMR
jgi:hypothetical protein